MGNAFGGAVLMNYVGHAGYDNLAAENLLTTSGARSLQNSPRLPVLTALSCVVGQYGEIGKDHMAEALVNNASGGAIAVVAPTGMMINADSVRLGEQLFGKLFAQHSIRLGEAVRIAMAEYAQAGGTLLVLQSYNLLGDPALMFNW